MTQIKRGLIMPDTKDLLTYYLIQAKEEGTYISNEDIADIIISALEDEDAHDIASRVLEFTNRNNE
jgi:hypothetical protein